MNTSIAYLDGGDLAAIRDRDNDGRDLLVDETSEGNNGFQVSTSKFMKAYQFSVLTSTVQDLTMFFDIQDYPELHFIDRLEEVLHGRPFGPLCDHLTGEASTPETKDFFGLGYDGKQYHFNGRVHAMPPQQ